MMNLNKRETILAVATALIVAVVAWQFFFSGGQLSLGTRITERDRLQKELDSKTLKVRAGRGPEEQLAAWNRQSLPADREMAAALYESWLRKLVDSIKFRKPRVEPGEGRDHRKVYVLLPYTVRAQATVEEFTQFLFEFYSAPHLHQIRHITLKPVEKSSGIDVVLSIEAMVLPTADRRDKLSAEPVNRLALKTLDEYRKIIGQRQLFRPYAPPAPPRNDEPRVVESPPKFDSAKYTFLTGVVQINGRSQAWFLSRTSGESRYLGEGDEFTVGPVQGKIVRIAPREVEYESEGARRLVKVGQNLREAAETGKTQPPKEPPAETK